MLPWAKLTGKHETHDLLLRRADGGFVALVRAGVIAEPVTSESGRKHYETGRKDGPHALRHYYASSLLAGGVSR